jgi:hypothetical protein
MVLIHLMPGLKTRGDPPEVPIHSWLPLPEKKLIMVSTERKDIHRKKEGTDNYLYHGLIVTDKQLS